MASNILYPTLPWLDLLLGDGLVKGGTYHIQGEPGVGKTTLAAQVLVEATRNRAMDRHPPPTALFLSGEQSAVRFASLLTRIDFERLSDFHYLFQRNADDALSLLRVMRPDIVVVDTVQTISHFDEEGQHVPLKPELKLRRFQRAAGEYTTMVFLSHESKPRTSVEVSHFDAAFTLHSHDGVTTVSTVKNRFASAKNASLQLYMTQSGFVPMIAK